MKITLKCKKKDLEKELNNILLPTLYYSDTYLWGIPAGSIITYQGKEKSKVDGVYKVKKAYTNILLHHRVPYVEYVIELKKIK